MRTLCTAAGLAAIALATAPPASAAGPYGPAPTGPTGVPGGYTNVVAAKTIGPAGGSIKVQVAGGHEVIVVPKNAFSTAMQVEITAPNLTQLNKALLHTSLSHYQAVAAIGIAVVRPNGTKFRGTLQKPLTLSVTAPAISAQSPVVELTGPKTYVKLRHTTSQHTVVIRLAHDPDIAVLRPR